MADVAKTASLAERLVAGEKRALARAITLIESDDPAGWELVREVYPRTGNARIIGFTGPPGVGKSTLIGALTGELRKAEREVAVLSIDPSSPFTRGALLGDRIRLTDHFLDPGVFIRSMASRGALGGLSEAAPEEEQAVGPPAPAGGGQQAAPAVAPQQAGVLQRQHPVAGEEAEGL
ncbi:MAG TPA: hypothetical protein VGK41_00410, partial [Solirubrobacterales bacterium]